MRDHQLDLDQVVDRDGSPLKVHRLVPPSRKRVEHRLVHVRHCLDDPAVLQFSGRSNNALDKHRPLNLGGERLSRVLWRITGSLLWSGHSLAEWQDRAAQLPTQLAAWYAAWLGPRLLVFGILALRLRVRLPGLLLRDLFGLDEDIALAHEPLLNAVSFWNRRRNL